MPEPEDHPDVRVFHEIEQIEYLVRNAITRRLPVGLTYPQYEVLNLLARRRDGLGPGEIATRLLMTKSGLTNTLQRLAARRLVAVAGSADDRRRKSVSLTAEGREAYGQVMAAVRPAMEGLREGFTQKEFREVLPFLKALRAWLAEKPMSLETCVSGEAVARSR
jgi:DNA-binding MarR family transcriptional regulator